MAGRAAEKRRSRDRTFTGCWTCRSRKVKCDEKKPCCLACLRIGLACSGYAPKLIWVENENQPCRSSGRRYIRCESVWERLPVLHSDVVDYLISKCDDQNNDSISSSCVMRTTSIQATHNPFRSFRFEKSISGPEIPRTLSPPGSIGCIGGDIHEKLLFSHYINHVATIMMPFEHTRNPWKSSYPAVALCDTATDQNALYSALLAHSAFNLAQLGVDKDQMQTLATKYYILAIRQLSAGIEHDKRQYAYTIAVISTLMMAEIYSGHSKTWRHHLKGAWALLCQAQQSEPWLESDFACVSTQSLYIINIISDTTAHRWQLLSSQSPVLQGELCYPDYSESLTTSIVSTTEFGFTIGGSKTILQCISRITRLAFYMDNGASLSSNDLELVDILSCLRRSEDMLDSRASRCGPSFDGDDPGDLQTGIDMAYHQLQAFVFATYIYLYRVIFDLPPQNLTPYVTKTFEHISAFSEENSGNLSLWPAFIAAVEAYTDKDMNLAKGWLNHAVAFGLGNRLLIKKVIEEVWRRRKLLSEEFEIDQSCVSVDWREVMFDLDVDVLLI